MSSEGDSEVKVLRLKIGSRYVCPPKRAEYTKNPSRVPSMSDAVMLRPILMFLPPNLSSIIPRIAANTKSRRNCVNPSPKASIAFL